MYRRDGMLSKMMTERCNPPGNSKTARLYFLIKTHKSPPTLRPLVSQVKANTENIAVFLDNYLQPIMKQLPSYLKNSSQLINELEELNIPENTILLTVDVKSLYTCIPHEDGIEACYRAWLKQERLDPQHPPAETLRHLLEIVLKLNTLLFNGKCYLQTHGTSMGVSFAPAYANIFMGGLDTQKILYFKRYIDDIIMLYDRGGRLNQNNEQPTPIN